jgi:glycosyltransferase involved in cell wall biosynthesis
MKLDFINLPAVKTSGAHGTLMPPEFEPGLVSVVLPTYNRAAFLVVAMRSVWEQTYRPVELLVVDDGSSDNTAEVVRQTVAFWPDDPAFRVFYMRQQNCGASAARNQGLRHSHGEFIQYLDSDDVLVRHKLASHVQVLQADKTLDLIWSDWQVVGSEKLLEQLETANRLVQPADKIIWQKTDKTIPWEPWPTLTRRRFVAQHPLWNEKTSRWDDWEYALRLMAANPQRAFAPGVVCIQREHKHERVSIFDPNPAALEKEFVAARAASTARAEDPKVKPVIDQLIADMYWGLFIKALRQGLSEQVFEAIHGAVRHGRIMSFRIKVSFLKIFLSLGGIGAMRALLRRRLLAN